MSIHSSDGQAAPDAHVEASDPARRVDVAVLEAQLSEFGARVREESPSDGPTVCVVQLDPETSLAALARLRDEESISMRRLVDLTAIDRLGIAPSGARFTVVYHLQSPSRRQRLRVEVPVQSGSPADPVGEPSIDSVTRLWPAANWLEREVFDLFGIGFRGHPDLRRILLDDAFEGAPLRKDYPRQVSRSLPEDSAS